VILDGNARIGENWRQQWDMLQVYTPAKYDGLPGLPFPGKPWSFLGRTTWLITSRRMPPTTNCRSGLPPA